MYCILSWSIFSIFVQKAKCFLCHSLSIFIKIKVKKNQNFQQKTWLQFYKNNEHLTYCYNHLNVLRCDVTKLTLEILGECLSGHRTMSYKTCICLGGIDLIHFLGSAKFLSNFSLLSNYLLVLCNIYNWYNFGPLCQIHWISRRNTKYWWWLHKY